MTELPPLPGRPRVGVVMATHDHERYVGRALESVFAQDYPSELVDVVVVDDGSTDGTPEVLARYADRVRVVRQENRGHLGAYDRGLAELGDVDLIALFDGDDLWPQSRISRHVDAFLAHPEVGIVYGDLEWMDDEERVIHPSHFELFRLQPPSGRIFGALLTRCYPGCGPTTVRACLRDRFQPIPPWSRSQDWWIAFRVAEVADALYLPEVATRYRRHGSNISAPENRIRLIRREIPFRRWMLRQARPETVATGELLAGLNELYVVFAEIGRSTGETPAQLAPAEDDAIRHLAAARAALDAGGRLEALFAAGYALAADPAGDAGRVLLSTVLESSLGRPADRRARPEPSLDAAPFVVAARLEDAEPLLPAFARELAGAEVTLAVVGEEERIVCALADAGEPAADLDVVAVAGAEGVLARRANAVLADAPPPGPLGGRPCFGAADLSRLAFEVRRRRTTEALSFALLIGAPSWEDAATWGDLFYARALQDELVLRGHAAHVLPVADWWSAEAESADVVVQLRGVAPYPPRPGAVNVLWVISHPELVTADERLLYDLVFAASTGYAAQVGAEPLLQATDPTVFFPDPVPEHAHELVFVGNARGVMRRILADLLPTEHELAIWGGRWEGLVDPRHLVGTFLPNDQVRRAYSSAAIVLNDHWDDMRDAGFVSNRVFDALACGAVVVSDAVAGIPPELAEAVVTYRTPEELRAHVDRLLADPAERARRGASGLAAVRAGHTFAHRVDVLLDRVSGLHEARRLRAAA